MDSLRIPELAAGLAKGDVALWLGPDWDPAAHEKDRQVVGQQPWLGVWSDARDVTTARWLAEEGGAKPRLLIEVPDRIEDALGEQYSIAEVCPYFYLRGRGPTDPLRGPARRKARDEKISRLSRLRQAALVITGYRSATALAEALEEIETLAPELRTIILTGVQENFESDLQRSLAPDLKTLDFKLQFTPLAIGDLLEQAIARRPTPVTGPTVRIGNASVPLAPFALREFPIDGDFVLLTESDVRPPDENENLRELFTSLISGRSFPWREFAHQLDWRRPLDRVRGTREWVARISSGELDVITVDVPAQAGAGLTTLLRQIAFSAATRGCPSLVFRGNGHLNYDRLRSFLTDLYQHENVDKASQRMPAVVVFDAQAITADSMGVLNDLPTRLARDGRRAIVLRGAPCGRSEGLLPAGGGRIQMPKRSPRTDYLVLPPLHAGLDANEQDDLAAWVTSSYKRVSSNLPEASVDLIRRWDYQRIKIPLLVCLYFILRDQFSELVKKSIFRRIPHSIVVVASCDSAIR